MKTINKIITFFIVLWVGIRTQNEILDEIKPMRLNSKWGFPYIGRSYSKRINGEESK